MKEHNLKEADFLSNEVPNDLKTFDKMAETWMDIKGAMSNRRVLEDTVDGYDEVDVNGTMMPCLVINLNGCVKGYIPITEVGFKEDLDNMSMKELKVKMRKLFNRPVYFFITQANEEANYCILSRKIAMEFIKEKVWPTLEEEQVRTAMVYSVNPYAAKLLMNGLEVRLPAEEMVHGFVPDARDILKVGDKIQVKIMRLNDKYKVVKVSLKALLDNPWDRIEQFYTDDMELVGNISGMNESGVFVALEYGVTIYCDFPATEANRIYLQKEIILKRRRDVKAIVKLQNIDKEHHQMNGKIIRIYQN